jgi:cytochrome c553
MKANMNPPSLAGDTAALGAALEKAAAFGPPGYTNWKSIANDGAKAAKGGDLAAAKASCRSCHDQYKKKYQAEFRTRKI